MKVAYLLFVYKNPKLIKKLIDSLSSKNSAFFIHIDKKSKIENFAQINGNNIFFSEERIPVYWAEFSGVQAILNLIRQALNADQKFNYMILLSGSDYPIRSKNYIFNFLKKNQGIEFINLVKMPCIMAGKPIRKINTYIIQSDKPVLKTIVKVFSKFGLVRRNYKKYLGSFEPYAGCTWWALTRAACEYILNFVDQNEKIVKYFKNIFVPEEMFFHTIIGNSPFKSKVRRNFMYADWSARGAHPEMITDEHINSFEKNNKVILSEVYGTGEMLFARKFSDENLRLIERIDKMIKQKDKSDY